MKRHAGRLIAAVLLLAASALVAHPLSVSYSSFRIDDYLVETVYRLPMDDMDLLLRLDRDIDGTVAPDELQAAREQIADYLREHTRIVLNGSPAIGELQQLDIWQDNTAFPYMRATVRYPSNGMILGIEINVNVLTHLYREHRNLAEFLLGEQREEYVFFHGNTWTGSRQLERSWQTAAQFLQLGILHIFGGYDHILFLLGLLLVAAGMRNLVLIITSFTLAHSITLALSTLGVVQPSQAAVEVLVAFSIAWVGLENILLKEFRYRWLLTFLFGLAHGFGFAGVLQNLNPDREGLLTGLLAFNLGVEIGQLAIVAVFLPLLHQLARSRYRTAIVRSGSTIILIFGTLWLTERIMAL